MPTNSYHCKKLEPAMALKKQTFLPTSYNRSPSKTTLYQPTHLSHRVAAKTRPFHLHFTATCGGEPLDVNNGNSNDTTLLLERLYIDRLYKRVEK